MLPYLPANTWILLCVAATVYFLMKLLYQFGKRLPPSPPTIPLLGNMMMLRYSLPHKTLAVISKKYGPIMSFWLGPKLSIIVSSPEAAREVLSVNDKVCWSRPASKSSTNVSFGVPELGITFSPAGDHLKLMRRLCSSNLFTKSRMNSYASIRMEEIQNLCDAVKQEADLRGGYVCIRKHLTRASLNNVMRICLSKRFEFSLPGQPSTEGDSFFHLTNESFELMAPFNVADYFPILQLLDVTGVIRRSKAVGLLLKNFLQAHVDEHRRDPSGRETEDFCDVMMRCQERLSDMEIISVLRSMLQGGSETSSSATEWVLLELLRHPNCMERLQNEVDQGFRKGLLSGEVPSVDISKNQNLNVRAVQFEELIMALPYLRAVVKETLRMHPVVPMLVPHKTIDMVTLGNGRYTIPKNTTIQINFWAIAHDPTVWNNPEEFNPDRFIDKDVDHKGTDFSFIPFGSGRRMCPGMNLGFTMVCLMVACLVHGFDWSPDPAEIDDRERNGLTVMPLVPLEAMVIKRK